MAQHMTTIKKRAVARGDGAPAPRPAVVYRPDTDIYETEDHVVVVADMPGVGPDDVEVTLENQVLTIRGRVAGHVHEGYREVYAEYGVGDFERAFTLSEEIDRDHIKASHKDGVLTVELSKVAAAKAKKISVQAA